MAILYIINIQQKLNTVLNKNRKIKSKNDDIMKSTIALLSKLLPNSVDKQSLTTNKEKLQSGVIYIHFLYLHFLF